jgi:hypothetical protein
VSRRCGRMQRGKNRGPFQFNPVEVAVKSNLTDISGELRGETERAFRFYDGKTTVWLPKSQCEWDDLEKIMTMPEWLAKEKELI